MKPLAALLLAFSITSLWYDVQSSLASARGAKAYEAKKYDEAANAFRVAYQRVPSPQNAFNLGTAEVAAGRQEAGSAALTAALKDPNLRADALFNRGNSALRAKALDPAIRDYIAALKANPQHAGAKRNLEIAMQRREQQRKQSSSSGQRNPQGQQQQKPQASPSQGQPQKPGELDLQALLRSVQQQEQDELRRMKARTGGDTRVGW